MASGGYRLLAAGVAVHQSSSSRGVRQDWRTAPLGSGPYAAAVSLQSMFEVPLPPARITRYYQGQYTFAVSLGKPMCTPSADSPLRNPPHTFSMGTCSTRRFSYQRLHAGLPMRHQARPQTREPGRQGLGPPLRLPGPSRPSSRATPPKPRHGNPQPPAYPTTRNRRRPA